MCFHTSKQANTITNTVYTRWILDLANKPDKDPSAEDEDNTQAWCLNGNDSIKPL